MDPVLLPPVDSLSESGDSGSRKRPVRKTGLKKKRVPLDDETHLRASLAKPCKCKRKWCYQRFAQPTLFSSLVQFRREWCQLHKLDQDREAPRNSINTFLSRFSIA